jgi:hypothetical protein
MGRYRGHWQDSGERVNCRRGCGRRGDTAEAARDGPRTLEGNRRKKDAERRDKQSACAGEDTGSGQDP